MKIDHIFIFSDCQGKEADELVKFGLTEGSNRIHPGQGTRNRKFYFDNFFLEIVWVNSESEIKSELTAPTKLWERANYTLNGASPFGLCLASSDDIDDLFSQSLKYRPSYIPEDLSFEIITNEKKPYLPWTCRLPATAVDLTAEPRQHQTGIEKLTKVKFGIQNKNFQNRFTDLLERDSKILFHYSDRHRLTLEFDNHKRNLTKNLKDIPLVIEY